MRRSASPRAATMAGAILLPALAALTLTGCLTPEGRDDALSALARWEDRRLADVDSLVALLGDDDAHVRRAALRTAGLIGRTDVLREMIAGLDDPSDAVRAAAAEALGYLGDPEAVAPLSDVLRGGPARVREAALFALARLPHDGTVFAETALHGDPLEAALAWTGLRDRAADADSAYLVETVRAGLVRPEPEILWRVLRCAERAPGRDLAIDVAAFTVNNDAQVRVCACRALGRMGGETALSAVLDCGERPGRFSRRDADRVAIAVYDALGSLGAGTPGAGAPGAGVLDDEAEHVRLVALLAAGARSTDPHVACSALDAMARLVAERPLPAAAALRESLLPVWRIRLLHSARAQLRPADDAPAPPPVVRAAAAGACIALRGAGLRDEADWSRIADDDDPLVREAVWTALCRHVIPPEETVTRASVAPVIPDARLRMAACEGLVAAGRRLAGEGHPDSVLARVDDAIRVALRRVVSGDDPYATANAVDLLAGYPSDPDLETLLAAHAAARGLPGTDVRRAVLGTLGAWFADSTYVMADSLRAPTAAVLEAGFDAPELFIRLAARAAASAGDLMPPELIPTEASLRATRPAHRRDPGQPPLALPFDAPRVRCVTDRGDVVLQLDGHIAPNTCAAFLDLIAKGFYEGLTFHRVVPDFVIQGGDPTGTGWGGPGFTLRSEWSMTPYERGTVGIAHSGKDTGSSQFFVALSPQPHLDGRYTVFGQVIDGMNVAESIQPGDTFRLVIEP